MKKILSLVLCAVLLALTLASCGEEHAHTFSEDWSYDENNHWHAATCEHTEEKFFNKAHVDANKDGVCDVCGYDADHEHTYQADGEWTTDAGYHWHAATCGHDVEGTAKAAHADADGDGACDVCAYKLNDHNHTFAADWTADATHHWHAADCGHDEVSDKAEHTYDAAGFCTVCDAKQAGFAPADVAAAIEAAKLRDGKVAHGFIDYEQYAFDYLSEEFAINFTENVTYQYADNFLHMLSNSSVGAAAEYWYTGYGEDSILALYNSGSGIVRDEAATVEYLNGYYFDGRALAYADEALAYGPVDFIDALYFIGSANANNDFVEGINDDGVYHFSFGYYADYYGLFVVEVAFALDAETGVLSLATVYVDNFTDGAFVAEEQLDANGAPILDENELPVVYYTVVEDADQTYTHSYVIRQSVEDYSTSFAPESIFPTAFDIFGEDGTAIDAITVSAGIRGTLYVGNVEPIIANVDLAGFTFSAVDADGNPIENVDYDSEYIWVFVDGDGNIGIFGRETGTYKVTVTCGFVSKTVDVTVEIPVPEVIDPQVVTPNAWGGYYEEISYDTYVYEGSEILLNIGVENDYCDTSFTAAITSANAADATIEAVVIDNDGIETTVYKFSSSVVGSYFVTFTSSVNPDATAIMVINVEEAPSVADILVGTYNDDWSVFEVIFEPSAEGATDGTVTINYMDWFSGTTTEVYSYAYADGALTTTLVSGDGLYTLVFADYALSITDEYGNVSALNPALSGSGLDALVDQVLTDGEGNYLSFTVYEDVYYCNFMDVAMGRPMNFAATYIVTEEGTNEWGETIFSFTMDGEAMGTLPFELTNVVYVDGTVIVTEADWTMHYFTI